MKFFNFFSRAPEEKASRALQLHVINQSPAAWSSRNYAAFSRQGYQTNVIVQSAINRIANAVATIKWYVEVDGQPVYDHPLINLFKKPNVMQSGAEWWRTRISYLLIHGNSYLERSVVRGKVKELWPLRPDRVKIVPGPKGIPKAYVYEVGSQKVSFPVDEITGDSDVRHTKLFHPTDDWYGMSPLEAAAYSIDQHNEAMAWVQGLLQNAARPSGALVVSADTSISDEEFNRIKREIDERYSGSRNAGRPMLLEGGLDWKPMGLSPENMEILRTKESAARDISLALGVPPLLLNIPGDNTYSNYREARLGFYEDTILPFITYELEEMNAWLSPFFDGAQIRPDLDSIEALADKRKKLWEMADSSRELTINERRELKGYPPLPAPLGDALISDLNKPPPQSTSIEEELKEIAFGGPN